MTTPAPADPPPAAGPAGSASSAATDPGPPVNVVPAPPPGPPTVGNDNLFTIVVPTEATMLQMGASAAGPDAGVPAMPGFRVSTATHAHITAQSPATTISLGAEGGMGMGGAPGLSFYSAGEKAEYILQRAVHLYDDTLKISCEKARTDYVGADGMTEDIHGGLIQTIEPNGSSTVTGPWLHKVTAENHDDYGSWKTDVAGPWTAVVNGDVSITTTGDHMVTAEGDHKEFWTGAKNSFTKGLSMSINIGGKLSFDMSASAEFKLSAGLSATAGIKTDISYAANFKAAFGTDFEIVAATKKQLGPALTAAFAEKTEKSLMHEIDSGLISLKTKMLLLDTNMFVSSVSMMVIR